MSETPRFKHSHVFDPPKWRSNVAPRRFGAGAHKPVDWTCDCGEEHRSYVVKCRCGVWRDRREASAAEIEARAQAQALMRELDE